MRVRRIWIAILFGLSMGACSLGQPKAPPASPASPSTATSPTPGDSASTVPSQPGGLSIWVPPAFSPDGETSAAELFRQRLAAFEASHEDFILEVRTKAETGPSGLLETLSSASIAAPQALPDVILLDQTSLNVATLKGYIQPLDGLVQNPAPPDWYDHALQAVNLDDGFFGLPFASETHILIYLKDQYESAPLTWSDLVNEGLPFLFPAGDPVATFTLNQYLRHGGSFTDESGLPTIAVDSLTEVLSFYQSARSNGVLSPATRQYTSAAETLAALRTQRASSGVAPLSQFLSAQLFDRFGALPLPARNEPGLSPSFSWSWVIVTEAPLERELAGEVITWLTEPDFLGPWTYELGLMPATASALATWPQGDASALVSSLVTISTPAPSTEMVMTFGPYFRGAADAVLNDEQSPLSAAQSAATNLRAQQSQ